MRHFLLLVLPLLIEASAAPARTARLPRISEPLLYTGSCGASAAAPAGTDLFVAADDEANQLRVYRRDQAGPALQVVDLTHDLELDRHAPETDIEGAARIGDRVYWISSHSRNTSGKQHANRYRFFATTLSNTNDAVEIAIVGRPYKNLLDDLISAPSLARFNLLGASGLPPKARGGLNIEALSATSNKQLLIGFRNPIPGGEALLAPLLNPEEIVNGKRAQVGAPITLDLGGLGIRDMSIWQGRYLIIAGPYDGGGKSKLFSWAGPGARAKHLREVDLKGLNPEAIVIYPDLGLDRIQLLSDDSTRQGDVPCNELSPGARRFRGVWVSLEPMKKR